jgi:predicted enzyme related to lactoylglutathione lyase
VAGELVYFVVPVTDGDRGKAFYGELLGWEFESGNVPGGFQITNTAPPGGLFAGGSGSTPSVYFAVDDIEEAVAKVRDLGGQVLADPEEIESGFMASCRDDQGTEFNLWSPKPDA